MPLKRSPPASGAGGGEFCGPGPGGVGPGPLAAGEIAGRAAATRPVAPARAGLRFVGRSWSSLTLSSDLRPLCRPGPKPATSHFLGVLGRRLDRPVLAGAPASNGWDGRRSTKAKPGGAVGWMTEHEPGTGSERASNRALRHAARGFPQFRPAMALCVNSFDPYPGRQPAVKTDQRSQ